MVRDAKALYRLLKKHPSVQSSFTYLSDENHATVLHEAIYRSFKLLYPEK